MRVLEYGGGLWRSTFRSLSFGMYSLGALLVAMAIFCGRADAEAVALRFLAASGGTAGEPQPGPWISCGARLYTNQGSVEINSKIFFKPKLSRVDIEKIYSSFIDEANKYGGEVGHECRAASSPAELQAIAADTSGFPSKQIDWAGPDKSYAVKNPSSPPASAMDEGEARERLKKTNPAYVTSHQPSNPSVKHGKGASLCNGRTVNGLCNK